MHPSRPPKKLPIDMMGVDTSKGRWGIFVDHVVETRGGQNLLIKIILEHQIDDERFRMLKLEIAVPARAALDPDRASYLAKRIGEWIGTNQEDGFLDLTDRN